MTSAWPAKPLESLCVKVTSGGTPSRSEPANFVSTGGHPWVKSAELRDSRIWDTEERISDAGLASSSAKYLPAATVLVAMYGANVGQLAMLAVPATVNQAVCGLVVDPSRAEPRYVLYALMHTRSALIAQAKGAAQQNLSATLIKQFAIPVPPLPVQRRIASILGTYDDLIEVNQRRIAVLEEMARRLFVEWFVHFRFPGHGETPLIDTAEGKMPDGWQALEVRDVVHRLPAGTVYRECDVAPFGLTPVIDQSTSEVLGFHNDKPSHVATVDEPVVIFGDHTCKMQLMISPFSLGPNTVAFVAKDLPVHYVFGVVRGLVTTHEYKRHWSDFMKKRVFVASAPLAAKYARLVRPLAEMSESLRKQNRCLRRSRDLLLPRLVSGAVEVAAAERAMEAVT